EDELGGTSQMFLAQLGADDFPGTSVVAIPPDGKIWRYNLETGHGDGLPTRLQGGPATTTSLAPGRDCQVYVGAHRSSGVMACLGAPPGEIGQLNGPEQADALPAHGADTFVGTYPEAGVFRAEGQADWDWGTNPEQMLELGRE